MTTGRGAGSGSRWWWELGAVVLVGILLLAALFGKLFADPFFYFSTDNSELYFPWFVMLGRALHEGRWPFLNPYWFAGSLPFAPLESGAMYPVTLLAAALVPPSASLDAAYLVFLGVSLLHHLLGAVAMYVLARRHFGLGAAAAACGALCYGFGGSFVGRFSHQPVLFTLAWLPLAVGGALSFVRAGTVGSAALAIVALWLMGVASHPQFFLYALAMAAAAVAWFALAEERARRARALGRGLIVVGLALGLLAPRILPLYELSRVTVRPAAFTTVANLFDSLSPLYYLTLLVPGLFGRHGVGYWGTDHPLGNWDSLLYVGVLPVLCAPLAVLGGRRREWGFALLGASVAVFLTLGPHWWVSAWVNRHLPLADVLTGLSKLTVVFHFSFVLLVALGVEALLRCPRRVRLVAVAAAASLSLAGLGVWLAPGVVAALAPAGRRAPSGAALSFAVESVRQARWIALAALATLWAGILAPRRAAPLVVAVVAADLALSLGHFNPIEASKGEPAVHYGGDAGSRLIQADGGTFRVAGLLPENAGMIARLETTGGYHTIETRAYASIHGFLDFREPALRPIYDLANIRYQRSTADLSAQGFDDAGAGVWRNRSALPRLFFAGECRGFADDDEMARYVAARPFEPSREVLLRSPECRRRPASEGSCRLREEAPYGEGYAGDCVVGEGGGWAVWSVLQYPGWTARVDEQPAVLVPADIAFYAVPLDAGTHRVALEYHSRGLRTGSWIAAVTGLVALGLLARRRGTLPRRRR